MKKSFLIIGLFSLMMVLTSFNTPNETGNGGKNSTGGLEFSNETGNGGKNSTGGLEFSNETGNGGKNSTGGLE